MATKRIIVLANAFKNHARCVAGRELSKLDGDFVAGGWIRPVSSNAERHGALEPLHYTLKSGELAAVLDIVDIPVTHAARDPGQPENWLIDESSRWKKVGQFHRSHVRELLETPHDLWFGSGDRHDHITEQSQARRTPQCSLLLIRPEKLNIRLWSEIEERTKNVRLRTRAVFQYRSQAYALPITDPEFERRHTFRHPPPGARPQQVPSPCGDRCVLCVSLTPPLNGYHYKIVATILELE